ncbi:hypothetical protein, partial [Novosphingobium sp. SG751A]|uniref:hypothetical protein n=1 Tax=Novosphingobium sp. SG751A TaxID=2587000 RepID=UPI001C12C7D7
GGSAATDYTQGRMKMQPNGHTRFYTTLTDVIKRRALPFRSAKAAQVQQAEAARNHKGTK